MNFWSALKVVMDIRQVNRIILTKEPIKYATKYANALGIGNANAGRTAKKWEPPAKPWISPNPVNAWKPKQHIIVNNIWQHAYRAPFTSQK